MGRLTTHILDTMSGKPAAGVTIELFCMDGASASDSDGAGRDLLAKAITNADGRCEKPLLEGDVFRVGVYELVFHVGEYFAKAGVAVTEPPFLDAVPVRFSVSDPDSHYHVPLLVSPYGYSTYRGS